MLSVRFIFDNIVSVTNVEQERLDADIPASCRCVRSLTRYVNLCRDSGLLDCCLLFKSRFHTYDEFPVSRFTHRVDAIGVKQKENAKFQGSKQMACVSQG